MDTARSTKESLSTGLAFKPSDGSRGISASAITSKGLLEDEDLRRGYENLHRGSPQKARESMRTLARLSRHQDTTPWEILASHEEGNGFRNALMDFVHDRLEEGKAPGYVNNYAKAAKLAGLQRPRTAGGQGGKDDGHTDTGGRAGAHGRAAP